MGVSRIHRILRLITLLQSGRSYNARQLAEELEVSRRTVFRDLNMLELAHIPYYYEPESGSYRITGNFFLPPVNLTLAEALGLLLVAGHNGSESGIPLISDSAKAALKIESVLPRPVRQHVGTVMKRTSVSLGPVSRHEEIDVIFDDLARAIIQRRVCRMVYVSFKDRRQLKLRVRPLRLVFLSRAWYLIAYSEDHGENRTFKLIRIRRLTPTRETFPAVGEDLIDEHFGQAWSMIPEGRIYKVHLHFEPMVAGNVSEVRWHPSQRVEWNDDGSIEFYAEVDGLGELSWWVMGYGDQVEVLAPSALRKRIRQTASRMAEKHSRGSGS